MDFFNYNIPKKPAEGKKKGPEKQALTAARPKPILNKYDPGR
jgi:hypothetical protein